MPDRIAGNFGPVSAELDAHNLPVTGELPPQLRGTLLRNGPNPQFPTDHPGAHWFTGDGMLHSVRLADGRAAYSNRWIRTPKFLAERAAGRSLYGGYTGGIDAYAPANSFMGGVANTHVVFHAGRLLALEEQHLPMEIDLATLDTIGYRNWAGALNGPFTAHPKIDPITGEMIFFGYHADSPRGAGLLWGLVDHAGKLTRLERFAAPYASMVHDFIVTVGHVVFPIMPLTASLARQKAGEPAYLWDPGHGTYVGVMRRDEGVMGLRWIRGETGFVFHVMNAWEDDGTLIADLVEYAEPPLFPRADGKASPSENNGLLSRWTLDLTGRSDRLTTQVLDDIGVEFPRIDDRFAGRRARHGWMAASADGGKSLNAIAHKDDDSGIRQLWVVPNGDALSEPVFVPRGKEEADGWLLSIAWRAQDEASDLVVLDARDVARGPIGTVRLPQRVPFGFHGNWVVAP